MDDMKLFSGFIFLFCIFLTIEFFQSLKQERKETVRLASALQFATVGEEIPNNTMPQAETKVTSSSLHSTSSVSLEFSRQAVYLFAILFRNEIDVDFYQVSAPVPLFKFFAALLVTVISPNAP